MRAYYNEFKPEAAHMLRQLIKDGLIAPGEVDERSIVDVQAADLKGYTQCHFFAGIGGWSVALRMAGWDDSRPVWTGSCPCQPFSTAGKQKGKSDERHLWPSWYKLIIECKPPVIFGEQVGSAIAHGWLDDVYNDLEREGYEIGAAVLPACSVGKPHRRDRLWFVADSELRRCERQSEQQSAGLLNTLDGAEEPQQSVGAYGASTLGNSEYDGSHGATLTGSEGQAIQHDTQRPNSASESQGASQSGNVANPFQSGLEGHRRHEQQHDQDGREIPYGYAGEADFQWIECPDGKARPIEPGICLLAHGVQHRAPILHAFGNAIVPSLAAQFILATKGEVW